MSNNITGNFNIILDNTNVKILMGLCSKIKMNKKLNGKHVIQNILVDIHKFILSLSYRYSVSTIAFMDWL